MSGRSARDSCSASNRSTRTGALVTLIPHTTSPRGTQFEVVVSLAFLKSKAFDAQYPITVPQPKLIKRLGALTSNELTAVEDSVRQWLGL